MCLAKQGQPLVWGPSFIDKGPWKIPSLKKRSSNEIINVVELMMNGRERDRRGRALCGGGEERCFISHAFSSQSLSQLQTPGLSALSLSLHVSLSLSRCLSLSLSLCLARSLSLSLTHTLPLNVSSFYRPLFACLPFWRFGYLSPSTPGGGLCCLDCWCFG